VRTSSCTDARLNSSNSRRLKIRTGNPSTTINDRLEFLNDQQLPAVVTAVPGESLGTLLTEQREPLGKMMERYGAILFRGFDLHSAADFQDAVALAFNKGLRDYIGGVSPRGLVMAGVYESTRFPAHLRIPQHNEMAYLPDPPRQLAFFCEIEPKHGGETPLADARTIYKNIPAEVLRVFEEAGISYHRYLNGRRMTRRHRNRHRIAKLHTSWMAAFSTEDQSVVEKACAENGSMVRWDREEGAMINNILPAVRTHPETGETLWFNQVATFLSSPRSTGLLRWLLYQAAFRDPYERPFHATLGDGRAITLAQLNSVHKAIDDATVRFRWRQGDLLIVDNFLVTHGRMPYRGERRILVAIH
jgi:alpha-ketoglutarate-dependent taurine dioxygenase